MFDNVRFSNTRDMDKYIEAPTDCMEEVNFLEVKDRMEEFMFLGMRMTDGVGFDDFETQFGVSLEKIYGDVIAKNKADGLLYEYYDSQRMLAPTKRGLDLNNYVLAQFLFD